jgi:hypothetical protein
MKVFEGDSALRATARSLDFLAYGSDVALRRVVISRAIIRAIGDRQPGDIAEPHQSD